MHCFPFEIGTKHAIFVSFSILCKNEVVLAITAAVRVGCLHQVLELAILDIDL